MLLMWHDTMTFHHVTVTICHLWHDTFLHFLCSKSKRKRKRNINNDLAILPSHDICWAGLLNSSANIDCLETWPVLIERSFQGLSIAIETVRIDRELMEIWPNEVCDIIQHVIDKSLGSIVILTHHELYAISSDTCQYLKDNVTTCHILEIW